MTASEDAGARVVQLVPLLKLRHLGDRRFDYLVPGDLADEVRPGSVVWAPFGQRTARAIVVGTDPPEDREGLELRSISSVTPDLVPEELLQLARRLADRYLSSYESALRLVAPPLRPGGGAGAQGRTPRNWVTPAPDEAIADVATRLTAKQRALLAAIPTDGGPLAAVCATAGVGQGVARGLAAKGLVLLAAAPVPSPGAVGLGGESCAPAVAPPRLWPGQQEALTALLAAYEEPGLAERILWGVTGSGKTEIYLRLIERALEDGAGAVLLVPEIALTPQMIERVRARFGDRVGVLHSGLAAGERLREYRRIARGDAPVVVGARSAVFAPVARLRLVILDEAHDGSYKQEEEPRYHARVVARARLEGGGGLLLEGSATPSVESVVRLDSITRLTERAAGAAPDCEPVDMRRQGGGLLLAPLCREALAETLRREEQAIVLLNRRGYAGHVHCDLCGHVMMCADCELALTYHSERRRLVCHHCGRTYAQPPLCPACGEAPLSRAAPGTERLDRELRTLVPHEKVFRLDSDMLSSGTRAQKVLEAFASARPAVLVGTQMVAKGHDFGDVTLVIVADADTGLYLPDFRASERTFQLLTQVAGRAGRAERPGRVMVQTWNPEVPCIRMALDRDEQGFYRQELETRRRLRYPPFAELIRLVTVAEDGERAQIAAQYLVERLSNHFPVHELRGPVRLPTLRGRARWHLLVAADDGRRARAIVGQAMAQLQEPYRRRGVKLLVDVDPQSFG